MNERYWLIHYSCGCGDNEDFIIAKDEEEAMIIAWQMAKEDYESYEGLHGIRGMSEIAEDDFNISLDELDYNTSVYIDIETAYYEEIESQLDYWVKEITYEQYIKESIEEEEENDE